MEATSRTNGQGLTPNTLVNYVGQHMLDIRNAHSGHPDFASLRAGEYPAWYTELRASFMKACSRFNIMVGDDVRFGSKTVLPLYHVNESTDNPPVDDSGSHEDYISAIDLRFILTKLLNGAKGHGLANKPFEKRAQLNLNASGVGRAGEVKFQDYTMWSFDPYLNVFDPTWMELKTLMTSISFICCILDDGRWLVQKSPADCRRQEECSLPISSFNQSRWCWKENDTNNP